MVLDITLKMTSGAAIDIDKYTRSGSQLLQEGELEKSKEYFELAFRSAQQHSDGFTERACAFNLGAVYIALNQPERGLEMLQRAIPPMSQRDGKSNGDLYYNFGLGYELLHNDSEAVKFFELAYEEYKLERENIRMENETAVKAAVLYGKLQSPLQAARCYGIAANGLGQVQDFTQQSLCLCKQAQHLMQSRRLKEAVTVADDCMILLQRVSSQAVLGRLYNELGLIYSQCYEFPKAATCFEFALPISQGPEGEKKKQAVILQNLGAVYNSLGEYQRALSFHERAASVHAELGDRSSQGQCFINLAFAYAQLADKDSAGECYLHALQAGKDTGEKQTQWQALEGLGAVAYHNDDIARAVGYFKQALATLAASGVENNMAQERIVMKLTDALQIQLSKQSPVDPKNVRAPSAMSSARGAPIQPAYQNTVQMAAPAVVVNNISRPPTRDEQRRIALFDRGRHTSLTEFGRVALGVSEYETDEDLSMTGDHSNPKFRPQSAAPRSRRDKPSGPIRKDVVDQSFARPPAMAAVAEDATAEEANRADTPKTDLSQFNRSRRMSRQTKHVHGVFDDMDHDSLVRRGKQSLLRTDTHNSEMEWQRNRELERARSGIPFVSEFYRLLENFNSPTMSGEYHERLAPSTEEEEEEEEGEEEEKATRPSTSTSVKSNKRDKILRMIKGNTYQQGAASTTDDENGHDPQGLSSGTQRVKAPHQQSQDSYHRQTTGETEDSHHLDSMEGTNNQEQLEEYQRRIRKLSRNDENGISGSGSETGSESESESEEESPEEGGKSGLPPPVPLESPPRTMLANTYEKPIPYAHAHGADQHSKEHHVTPGPNYFRPSSSSDGEDQRDRAAYAKDGKLKETIQDPNDPDYQTIRSLKMERERQTSGGDRNEQHAFPSISSSPDRTGAPPLPPRKMDEMSRAEQNRPALKKKVTLGVEEGGSYGQQKRENSSSKACVVM